MKVNKNWWVKISGWHTMLESFKFACIDIFLKNIKRGKK
jgi:hypothetical protein